MEPKKSRAVIYARVSSARQAEDGLPVQSQVEQCRAKAAALGAVVVREFRDEGISGRTTNRPAFLEAVEFCEDERIEYFICWSTSRFARNRLDAALYKRTLERFGTRLVYASQDFGEGDDAWLPEAILEVMDEQYSRTVAKDTRRSMAQNASDGFWNGGRVPFGFSVVPVGRRKRLAPHDAEKVVVAMIFRWYLGGMGMKHISETLNGSGISRRGKKWDKNAVSSVLKNPVAVGRLEWRVRGQKVGQKAHDHIVTEEDFENVQHLMRERAPVNVGGRPRSEGVLSGILRCGFCGEAMMTECATGRGGKRYHYYNCRSFLKGMGCASKRVPVSEMDGFVLDAILSRVFTPENLRGLVVEMRQQSSAFERDRQARIDALAKESADVERRLVRLFEAVEGGAGLELADVAPRIRALRDRQKALAAEVEQAMGERGQIEGATDEDMWRAAQLFRDMVRDCDEPAKIRQFLGMIVKQASIEGENVTIEYWPERIASTVGDSQCSIRWLPDPATLRISRIVGSFHHERRRAG